MATGVLKQLQRVEAHTSFAIKCKSLSNIYCTVEKSIGLFLISADPV
jgi:hypothetical protein